ncbi:MAG: DUF115 domain-containing protein [Spirochaetes bacterium]|nr:DUF115 domain-containing protein [Spirochaetota bacterium]
MAIIVKMNNLFEKINEGILNERFRAFNINLDKNLPLIREFGGLQDIISHFNDKHVIIVGAGASLDKGIGLLRKYQHRDNLTIIAADMALLPLCYLGIIPKYVISCETTPVDYFSSINTNKMHLLAFSCMSNTNLRKWHGNISFYNWMIHNEFYDKLWEKAGSDLGFVATGSIVTTQAVSIVLGCNIQSLMILGNDMGFKGEYYVKETVNFKKYLFYFNRFNTLEKIEFDKSRTKREFEIRRGDRLYYTNNQFMAAKEWLEDLIKRITIPIYEANDLGCSPRAVRKVSLKTYLERFDKRSDRRK